MAHPPHTKAKALDMLMLGDSPRYVAQHKVSIDPTPSAKL